jgi:NADH-quinone oxidoreductase subunit J
VFSAVMIGAALLVIASRNPVHSVLFLILAFFNAAALFVLLGAEFLAMILVVVYVGAVAVLFLFVVMMLDINIEEMRLGFTRFAWLGWLTALVVVLEIAGVVAARTFGVDVARGATPLPAGYSNTAELGRVLYTQFAYPFELAAMVLLVAIIAAITLTMRKRPGHKVQNASRQVAVRAQDRIRIVKMQPEKRT